MGLNIFKHSDELIVENNLQPEAIETNQFGFSDTDFIRELQSKVATDKEVARFQRYI